jgi:hypothetical protein
MDAHPVEPVSAIETVRRVDRWAREQALDAARALELTV